MKINQKVVIWSKETKERISGQTTLYYSNQNEQKQLHNHFYQMQLFCANATINRESLFFHLFWMKNIKKLPSKVAHFWLIAVIFSTANGPTTIPNLKFCFIKWLTARLIHIDFSCSVFCQVYNVRAIQLHIVPWNE